MNEKQLLTDEKLLSAFKMFDKVRNLQPFKRDDGDNGAVSLDINKWREQSEINHL